METLDLNSLKANLDSINSAFVVSQIAKQNEEAYRIARAVSEQNARRDAKIVAGAEANVAQKELMEEQLGELKAQNDILAEQLKAEQVQREILEEHLKVTTEQNTLLSANYQKLEEMYNSQKESNDEARKDLHKSRVFNAWMMVIAIVAMLAAISGPIVTVIVSR